MWWYSSNSSNDWLCLRCIFRRDGATVVMISVAAKKDMLSFWREVCQPQK
jgi:hypothetical protein